MCVCAVVVAVAATVARDAHAANLSLLPTSAGEAFCLLFPTRCGRSVGLARRLLGTHRPPVHTHQMEATRRTFPGIPANRTTLTTRSIIFRPSGCGLGCGLWAVGDWNAGCALGGGQSRGHGPRFAMLPLSMCRTTKRSTGTPATFPCSTTIVIALACRRDK